MKTTLYFFIGITLLLFCNVSQGFGTVILPNDQSNQTNTTIYEMPDNTAVLQDGSNYFLTNNKYRDWNEADRKRVVIQGVVEIDGTITDVKVVSK